MSRDEARRRDAADPLRHARDRFALPDGIVYLDGNSLGALPRQTAPALADLVEKQWGRDLITSWNRNGWIDAPFRIAARLSDMLGATPEQLLIADSTSVCLFKLLAAAVAARPDRTTILAEEGSFPTDLYVAQGLCDLVPRLELRTVPAERLEAALDASTAVLMLTHVDYRSGSRHDMAALNAAAHESGALVLWDLSHSAGALQLDLDGSDCDLAVGCGYKYLNGGPGAPAFLYVAKRLQAQLRSPLSGWMGHADPFEFAGDFRPAPGIARFLTGTPSILALAALDNGIGTFDGIAIDALEAKSRQLTQFFIEQVEARCGSALRLASPRDPALRGSHVSFAHPDAYAVMQALIARGVIGDFRQPDLVRFGFAPLYNSFEEAWGAAATVADILDTGAWDRPQFQERRKVT